MSTNVATKFKNSNEYKLQIAHRALHRAINKKPNYFIEDVTITFDKVEVVFIDTDIIESGIIEASDWKEASIGLSDLEEYILNDYPAANTFDGSNFEGEHIQYGTEVSATIFLEENMRNVVKSYLESKKGGLICA